MRWIAYMLVAVNLLTFAWLGQHQESRSEDRETPNHAATADGVKTIRLLSELEPIIKVAARTQFPSQAVGRCHTIGPFKDNEVADDALARMKDLGIEGAVHFDKANVKIGYWVYFKSMQTREVENIIQLLKNNDIKDYHKNERNELSLGIYNRLEDAERRQMNIAVLGYSPLVGPFFRNQNRYWIDVAEEKINMLPDEAWDSYMTRYPDSQRRSMKCNLINA
jgi:hypothetical protein